LRKWRSRDYRETYSASKIKGGGVLLDLSHEIDYAYWIFGKLKVIKSSKKKLSKLKISSEDSVDIDFKTKDHADLKMHLNYINKTKMRIIVIYGFDFKITCNLVNNTIQIIKNKKIRLIKFKKTSLENSYIKMHKSILKNDYKNVSNYKSAIYILKLINLINIKSKLSKN